MQERIRVIVIDRPAAWSYVHFFSQAKVTAVEAFTETSKLFS